MNFVPAHSARTVLVCAAPDPVSAPVTANHLSSEPESTKTIGATQLPGRLTVVLMSESPLRVAGNPLVMMLTVETLACPSSVTQLTSARNDVSSLMPRNSGGTSGSLVKTSPRTEMLRWPSVVSEPVALVSIHGERFSGTTDQVLPLFLGPPGTEREVARRYARFGDYRGLALWLEMTMSWRQSRLKNLGANDARCLRNALLFALLLHLQTPLHS